MNTQNNTPSVNDTPVEKKCPECGKDLSMKGSLEIAIHYKIHNDTINGYTPLTL